MKETLASLFKPYRPITPIVAHRNTRMRGQAFVSFHDKASAEKARSDVNEFPLYGKPIVSSSVLRHRLVKEGRYLQRWELPRPLSPHRAHEISVEKSTANLPDHLVCQD